MRTYNESVARSFELDETFLASKPHAKEVMQQWLQSAGLTDAEVEAEVDTAMDAARRKRPFSFELEMADGRVYEVRHSPLSDGGYVRTFANITDRKRIEEDLAVKQAQLRAALDNMSDGILMLDGDLNYVMFNQRYIELVGMPEELIAVGKPIRNVLLYAGEHGFYGPGDPQEQVRQRMASYEDDAYLEIELETHAGLTVALRKSAIEGGGAVSVLHDITERKRAEREIKEQNENMTLLNRVANAVNEAGSADEALAGCLREICRSFGWPVSHAYLHNAGGEPPLLPSKVWHVEADMEIAAFRDMTEATTFELGQGLPGRVLENNAPAWIVDVTKDANFPRAAAAEAIGVKAGFAFPASIGDNVVAVMEFFSNESSEPDQRMLETLGNIGQQLGGAIRRKIAEQDLQQAYSVIRESVEYASNIQRAALPFEELLANAFDDHFIIWEPRDVVGGDIYWLVPVPDGYILGVADCTGHGVPGAFVTLLATSALRRAISEQPDADPARLIARMNRFIKEVLGQYSEDAVSNDGLELGLCRIEPARGRLAYAGARFSLWRVQDGKASEFKGDKSGIGYSDVPLDLELTNHEIAYDRESRFYLYSDGFLDQIGGPKRHALGKRRLMRHIIEHRDEPLSVQRELIADMFRDYQGDERRRDDLIMIGFKI